MQNRVNQLAQDLNNCQQGYNLRGRLWHNASLVWDKQSKIKRTQEIIYKVYIHQLEQELQRCHNHGGMLEYWHDQLVARYWKWKNKTHDARQLILIYKHKFYYYRIINL